MEGTNQALEVLQKVNWFLKPVKDLILFLFTTKTGIFILIGMLFLYLIYSTSKKLTYKKLLREAARRRSVFSPFEVFWAFVEEVIGLFVKLINNATVLIVVLLLLIGIVGLSAALESVDNFVRNQQKIKELKTVLKNLDRNYEVAKIKILDYDYRNNITTLEVKFFDYANQGYLNKKQVIKIKGRQIYLLSLVINFEYSEIEGGERYNLVLPLKVYSEVVPSSQGVMLRLFDEKGIPLIYYRREGQLYGIDSAKYYSYLQEISRYISDSEYARKNGVRSIIGAAPHNIRYPRKGQVYVIYVEQTGGLVLKQEEF